MVRQVRESDMMELQLRIPPPTFSATTTALSSPSLPPGPDMADDLSEDAMMVDAAGGLGLSGSFKQQALRNSKGRNFWDTFSEPPPAAPASSSSSRTSPPPPIPSYRPRGSSSAGLAPADVPMDSLSAGAVFRMTTPTTTTTTSSSGIDTPQPVGGAGGGGASVAAPHAAPPPPPPTAAEITRRINSKRRRDDDFDPGSFKRRAVSPGMSVHNSPIMQSPLQRDTAPWGSRPGSNGGGGGGGSGGSGAPSENGSQAGGGQGQGQGSGANCRVNGNKVRIGFQGMADTNDGITKLSIE